MAEYQVALLDRNLQTLGILFPSADLNLEEVTWSRRWQGVGTCEIKIRRESAFLADLLTLGNYIYITRDSAPEALYLLYASEAELGIVHYERGTPEHINAIYAAGQGEGTFRDLLVRASAAATNELGRLESFIDARDIQQGDYNGLTARADAELAQRAITASTIVKAGAPAVHEYVTVRGVALSIFLLHRLALPPPAAPYTSDTRRIDITANVYDTVTGAADDVMRHYVTTHLIAPADPARTVPNLVLAPPLSGTFPTVSYSARFQPVLDVLQEVGINAGCGFEIVLIGGQMQFTLIPRRDRSIATATPIIFTDDEVLLDIPSRAYRQQWDVGDLITVHLDALGGLERNLTIQEVAITLAAGKADVVSISLDTMGGDPLSQLGRQLDRKTSPLNAMMRKEGGGGGLTIFSGGVSYAGATALTLQEGPNADLSVTSVPGLPLELKVKGDVFEATVHPTTGKADYTSVQAAHDAGAEAIYIRLGSGVTYDEDFNWTNPKLKRIRGEAIGKNTVIARGDWRFGVDDVEITGVWFKAAAGDDQLLSIETPVGGDGSDTPKFVTFRDCYIGEGQQLTGAGTTSIEANTPDSSLPLGYSNQVRFVNTPLLGNPPPRWDKAFIYDGQNAAYDDVTGLIENSATALNFPFLIVLNGAMTNVQTTFVYQPSPQGVAVGDPLVPGQVVLIDSERMRVTAVNTGTKTATVTRAYDGTTGVTHADGAGILRAGIYPLSRGVSGDLLYLGTTSFRRVSSQLKIIPLGPTFSSGALDLRYWNGSAWTGITYSSYPAVAVTLASRGYISFTPPADWALTTVNGVDAYWLRFQTTVDFGMPPKSTVLAPMSSSAIRDYSTTAKVAIPFGRVEFVGSAVRDYPGARAVDLARSPLGRFVGSKIDLCAGADVLTLGNDWIVEGLIGTEFGRAVITGRRSKVSALLNGSEHISGMPYGGAVASATGNTLTASGTPNFILPAFGQLSPGSFWEVLIIAGTGEGQKRRVIDCTASILTIDPGWTINPDATSIYVLYDPLHVGVTGDRVTDIHLNATNIGVAVQGHKGLLVNNMNVRGVFEGCAVAVQAATAGATAARYFEVAGIGRLGDRTRAVLVDMSGTDTMGGFTPEANASFARIRGLTAVDANLVRMVGETNDTRWGPDTVRKNSGADIGSMPRWNFIEGANVTLTVAQDLANDELAITIAAAGGGGGGNHAILSATHTDTLVAGVQRGDLIVGNATPAWARLAVGGAATYLRSNGTDPAWATAATLAADLPDLTQYALLAGRAGTANNLKLRTDGTGVLTGSGASGGILQLVGTDHATPGIVEINRASVTASAAMLRGLIAAEANPRWQFGWAADSSIQLGLGAGGATAMDSFFRRAGTRAMRLISNNAFFLTSFGGMLSGDTGTTQSRWLLDHVSLGGQTLGRLRFSTSDVPQTPSAGIQGGRDANVMRVLNILELPNILTKPTYSTDSIEEPNPPLILYARPSSGQPAVASKLFAQDANAVEYGPIGTYGGVLRRFNFPNGGMSLEAGFEGFTGLTALDCWGLLADPTIIGTVATADAAHSPAVTIATLSASASLPVNIPAADTAYSPIVAILDGGDGIDAVQTNIGVNNNTNIEVNDIIKIDSEMIKVTAKPTGTSLTGVRGVAGSTAAAHAESAPIVQAADAFVYTSTGDPFAATSYYRIDNEVVLTLTVDTVNDILWVARGYVQTLAAAHVAASAIVTSINSFQSGLQYDSVGDPVAVGDIIVIDSERMLVQTVDGIHNKFDMVRGYQGTAAAIHSAGAPILKAGVVSGTQARTGWDGGSTLEQDTGASSGANAGLEWPVLLDGHDNPIFVWQFRVPQLTNERVFIGFTNQTLAMMLAADNPVGHYAGLSFTTSRGDINYKFVTSDGVTQYVADSGVPPALIAYFYFRMEFSQGVTFALFDETWTQLAEVFVTSSNPNSYIWLRLVTGIRNLAAESKRFEHRFGSVITQPSAG